MPAQLCLCLTAGWQQGVLTTAHSGHALKGHDHADSFAGFEPHRITILVQSAGARVMCYARYVNGTIQLLPLSL